MLLKWTVQSQRLTEKKNSFIWYITQIFRPDRGYAQANFDDIFVHSRADRGCTNEKPYSPFASITQVHAR